MTQRVILFNGPPSCGKDTAARACMECEDFNGLHRVFDRMSMPIKRAFAATVGANIDRWGNVALHETNKEIHNFRFSAIRSTSYRQWQIDFSERYMKPLYGEAIFGGLFCDRNLPPNQHPDATIFVPDCGFDIEYRVLSEIFGPSNVLVVKIFRPGHDFRGDSRNYLKVGSFGDKRDTEEVIHVNNASTLDDFRSKIIRRVGAWLTQPPPVRNPSPGS